MKLDQIRALIEAATRGPYRFKDGTIFAFDHSYANIEGLSIAHNVTTNEGKLFAASRTLMPRMEASLTRIRERCEEFPDNPLARDILDEIAALEAE